MFIECFSLRPKTVQVIGLFLICSVNFGCAKVEKQPAQFAVCPTIIDESVYLYDACHPTQAACETDESATVHQNNAGRCDVPPCSVYSGTATCVATSSTCQMNDPPAFTPGTIFSVTRKVKCS